MTTLLLSVIRGPSAVLHQTRVVSSGAFQIGRASPSDWVLEDPRRVMSKRHCVFRQDAAGWSVSDVSRNGSFVSRGAETRRLGAQPHRLIPGERVRFGDYELAVDLQEDEASFMRIPRAVPRSGIASTLPPDVPPRSYPRPSRARGRKEDEPEPTRFMLRPPPTRAHEDTALSALLGGAALGGDALVVPAGREGDVLRAAGASLRAAVSGLRDLRFATLGEAGQDSAGATQNAVRALPLVGARNDHAAMLALLGSDGTLAPESVHAAFREIQSHHDWLVRAARRSLREAILGLDPETPDRALAPHWLDLLPGWRRWRGTIAARRRYRRLTGDLDRAVDQALARAYWDVRREQETRWTPP